MREIKRLTALQEAVEKEKKHEVETFKQMISVKSLHQLTEEGLAWYPLSIVDNGYTLGEYPYYTVEIASDKYRPHQFKSGAVIQFFHNHNGDINSLSCSATIYYISKNQAIFSDKREEFDKLVDADYES